MPIFDHQQHNAAISLIHLANAASLCNLVQWLIRFFVRCPSAGQKVAECKRGASGSHHRHRNCRGFLRRGKHGMARFYLYACQLPTKRENCPKDQFQFGKQSSYVKISSDDLIKHLQ